MSYYIQRIARDPSDKEVGKMLGVGFTARILILSRGEQNVGWEKDEL